MGGQRASIDRPGCSTQASAVLNVSDPLCPSLLPPGSPPMSRLSMTLLGPPTTAAPTPVVAAVAPVALVSAFPLITAATGREACTQMGEILHPALH